jgi:hypothetical protein
VPETQSGSAQHFLSRIPISISRHQHAAPVRRAFNFRLRAELRAA